MDFTRKTWVNKEDIPENELGQHPRFDADNMNRIEAGIEEAHNSVGEHTHSKGDIGLDNVDNTSDASKPVSTAQATAIADAKKAGTDAQSGLNSHSSDTTKHITSAERTTWNGKANGNHTHTPASIGAAATSHNQGANTITAGTLGGQVKANTSAMTSIDKAQVRDIYAGLSDMTAGSSSLATGTLYFVYE